MKQKAPISMRVHPPHLHHSFLLRLKSLFLLIFQVFLFMVLMELHCNKSSFFGSIASMILRAIATMAQTKVKNFPAHSSIGHVGIRTSFSCGTIEGIQSLLIGLFIYASMTIHSP